MKPMFALFAACAILTGMSLPSVAAVPATDMANAAANGDAGKLKSLIAAGGNMNGRDNQGYTPLMWAALNGHINVVATLIHLGANLNVQDNEGYSALMWASQNKHETVVRQLLNAGATVNTRDSHGYTALLWAAQDGQGYIVEQLLQRGADPNARDAEGYSSIMWAAQQGHSGVARTLLSYNANPGFRDRRGYSAMDLATAFRHGDIQQMLRGYKPGTVPASYVGYRPSYVTPVAAMAPRWSPTAWSAPTWNVSKPSLVAVVNAPGDGTWARGGAWGTWANNSMQYQLSRFDVDRNQVVNGHDWRRLVTTSRVSLATLIHDARCGRRNCTTHHYNQIINKLDWVYADASRLDLTVNMAHDLPGGGGVIRW